MILSQDQVGKIMWSVPLSEGKRVVLVDVSGRRDIPLSDHNANIYCIGIDESILWQVQVPASKMERDPFVSLEMDGGLLRADRFFGGEFSISIETGEATEIGWHK